MSDPSEFPSPGVGKKTPMNAIQDRLYVLIVAALTLYFVIGGIAWGVMAYNGKSMPEGLATTIATTGGGLLGTPRRGPKGGVGPTSPYRPIPGGGGARCRWWCRGRGRGGRVSPAGGWRRGGRRSSG